MKLSVIIPMYNENSIVLDTAAELGAYLDGYCAAGSHTFELLFSDDGSADGCGDTLRNWIPSHPFANGEVRVVTAERNYGKGHAIGLGMAAATGDYALYTDCDLAYGVEVIGKAADAIMAAGTDILIGSRNLAADGYEGYTFLRKLASKTYIKVLCLYAGFRLSDSQCGFKCFKTSVGQALFAKNGTNGWAFDIEILLRATRAGYTITEFPVKILRHRESKIHLVRDSMRMLSDIRKIKRRLRAEK